MRQVAASLGLSLRYRLLSLRLWRLGLSLSARVCWLLVAVVVVVVVLLEIVAVMTGRLTTAAAAAAAATAGVAVAALAPRPVRPLWQVARGEWIAAVESRASGAAWPQCSGCACGMGVG